MEATNNTGNLATAIAILKESLERPQKLSDAHAAGWFRSYDVYKDCGMSRGGMRDRLERMFQNGEVERGQALQESGQTVTVYRNA